MKLTNTDGHDVAVVEDHFEIQRGALEPVLEKLAALDGMIVDEHDRKGAKLTFTRPGNALHRWWTNTVVGSARLTPTRLIVSTNSIERAEALAEHVRNVLGGLATWKKRTREELPAAFGGETITIDAQATDSPLERRDAFRAWLDSPIPKLGGRTPREAVHDAIGRHDVHLLLKTMENRQARKPVDGFDPAQLRRELGLDDLGQLLPHLEFARAIGTGRKLSETLLDFAQPLLDADPGRRDEHRMRTLLAFAINVYSVLGRRRRPARGSLSDRQPSCSPCPPWLTGRPVSRSRMSLGARRALKSNMLVIGPASSSNEPSPIRPRRQLSSMKRMTEV